MAGEQVCTAEIEMEDGIPGAVSQGILERSNGCIVFAQGHLNAASRVVAVRVPRVEPDRTIDGLLGLGKHQNPPIGDRQPVEAELTVRV